MKIKNNIYTYNPVSEEKIKEIIRDTKLGEKEQKLIDRMRLLPYPEKTSEAEKEYHCIMSVIRAKANKKTDECIEIAFSTDDFGDAVNKIIDCCVDESEDSEYNDDGSYPKEYAEYKEKF